MTVKPSLSYEWYIPERVYIIQPVGVLTPTTLYTMQEHVLTMLHEPYRSTSVHLVFDATFVHLDRYLTVSDLERCSTHLYRHPLTASVLTVTGMNRFYTFVANAMSQMLSRRVQGRAMRTLNEALRFTLYIDSSLPPMNI